MRSSRPIFILGITGRSGTNYLRDLIIQHPDCARAVRPAWEDFYLAEAGPLFDFVGVVRKHWRRWDTEDRGSDLLEAIGTGLVRFLNPETDLRVVTKTPSVRNLNRFFDLFPQAHLVILVRDARSVAASAVKSFGGDYALWARTWSKAARQILEFEQSHRDRSSRYKLIRYEDMQRDTRSAMEDLLAFLELDPSRYDFESAENLPVRGSSELAENGDLHWQPVDIPSGFDPHRRWENWPKARLERFDWIAGTYLEAFGYPRYTDHQRTPMYHRVTDLRDLIRAGMVKTRARSAR